MVRKANNFLNVLMSLNIMNLKYLNDHRRLSIRWNLHKHLSSTIKHCTNRLTRQQNAKTIILFHSVTFVHTITNHCFSPSTPPLFQLCLSHAHFPRTLSRAARERNDLHTFYRRRCLLRLLSGACYFFCCL